MAATFVGVLAVAPLRTFFALVVLPAFGWIVAAVAAAIAITCLEAGWRFAAGWHDGGEDATLRETSTGNGGGAQMRGTALRP
jgi:uncharacterized protein (DUF697 family)